MTKTFTKDASKDSYNLGVCDGKKTPQKTLTIIIANKTKQNPLSFKQTKVIICSCSYALRDLIIK